MSTSRKRAVVAVSAALIGFVFSLQAQDASGDDPSHSVPRISLIQGEVNVQRGDSGEVVAAALNAPLQAQDHLQTADGSRAEIQFDSSNMVRLAAGTDVGIGNMAYRQYQLQLATGTIEYRVLRESERDRRVGYPEHFHTAAANRRIPADGDSGRDDDRNGPFRPGGNLQPQRLADTVSGPDYARSRLAIGPRISNGGGSSTRPVRRLESQSRSGFAPIAQLSERRDRCVRRGRPGPVWHLGAFFVWQRLGSSGSGGLGPL